MEENKMEVVKKLVKEKIGKDDIDYNATLATYGLDSLDVMEFIMDLEERFNVEFDGNQLSEVKTVGELLNYIENSLK